jgi:tRNA dimethylallyltransferase
MTKPNLLLVILGPTASGKTRLAARLAQKLNGEILSADSRQVYQDLNIGTGKDYQEYIVDNHKINYHLIDVCSPFDSFDLSLYLNLAKKAFDQILEKKKLPILCGGTGLYIKAVLQNFNQTQIPVNKELRNYLSSLSPQELQACFNDYHKQKPESLKLNATTSKRQIRAIEMMEYLKTNSLEQNQTQNLPFLAFGLKPDVVQRRELIARRLRKRLEDGLIEEVENLLLRGLSAEKLIFFGLEYKFITQYLINNEPIDSVIEKLTTAIQQFAKRQMTFFRHLEKNDIPIHWLESQREDEKINEILMRLEKYDLKFQ